jgi:tetratricopeptide (TPR) repeat protein
MTVISSKSAAKGSRQGKRGKGQPSAATNATTTQELRKAGWSVDWQTVACCAVLFAAVCGFYSSVTRNGFVRYDDEPYILKNHHVQAGLTWSTVKWAFLTGEESNWHPLTWLSHALDCEFLGVNPVGHHWVNVVFHGLNTILLFLFFRYSTGFRWRSLMVAGLFALHPINVESVAWAAERKNTLSMLLFLLAFYAYVWYTRKPEKNRYWAVGILYALALMAKPQVITFPFLALLWDYWPLRRMNLGKDSGEAGGGRAKLSLAELVKEKMPLFALSAASAIVTMAAQHTGGAMMPLSQVGPASRLETAVIAYARYLEKLFWPVALPALYPHLTHLYPAWQVVGALLLLLLITAGVLLAKERYLAMGWFWYLGSLVPMIGLVQVGEQEMANRYAYLSFLGLFVMLVWLIAEKAEALGVKGKWLAIPAVACLLALGIRTYQQVHYWHDTEVMWRRTLEVTQENYVAEDGLGGYLRMNGRTEEAVAHYRAALAIKPDDPPALLNLGAYDHTKGNLKPAIEKYQFVAEHGNGAHIRAKAYANMGFAYRQLGDPAKAKDAFQKSLELDPDKPPVMLQVGVLEESGGNPEAAIPLYERAIRLQPASVAYLLLAHAFQAAGHSQESQAAIKRAADLSHCRNTAEASQACPNLDEAVKQAKDIVAGAAVTLSGTAE